MRITKVTKIRGHRVFKDFSWPKELHCFGQFNLIYGWNGCGKTTLSSLFKHLERPTNLTEGSIEFEIDEDRKCSGTAIVSASLPPVRVFNRDFVKATIDTAGTSVEPIYYLGEDSIEKQAKVDELKNKRATAVDELAKAKSTKTTAVDALDRFCIDKAKAIKELLIGSQGAQYNNYDKRQFKQSIAALQAQTDAQTAPLADDEKEQLRKQKDSQRKPDLSAVTYVPPDFVKLADDAKGLLGRSVASKTIDALAQDKAVAAWVQQGLALHSGDRETSTCYFCLQPLTVNRRKALEGHFNDAFAAFQQEISSAMTSLGQQVENLNNITFPDAARAYDHLQNELGVATSKATRAIQLAAAWLTEVRNALEEKKSAPFGPSQLGGWQNQVPTVDGLRDSIAAVTSVVSKHNSVTSNFRDEVVEACRKLEQHYVADAWDEHASLAAAITAAEDAIKPLQDEISRLENEIANLERDILEHRRPANELNDELRSYLGRDELRFDVRGNGYALTRAGQRVSDLSEGERTAIAFLYFLKTLRDRGFELTKGVVVIDDPVSSLDANSLHSAFGYMQAKTKECGQLFVLTHNFSFFRQVKNWFHHLPKQNSPKIEKRIGRFFMLKTIVDQHNGRTAQICALDSLLDEYDSEYQYLFKCVWESSRDSNGNVALRVHYSMPNVARRLLEAFFAFRHPEHRVNNALHESVERTRFDEARKKKVLRFVHTFSHAGRIQDMEEEPWGLAETAAVLADVLGLIQHEDPKHYSGMEQLVNGKKATA